jgi:serine/threonine protein phosphatase 1
LAYRAPGQHATLGNAGLIRVTRVQYFGPNRLGRDFVTGDIHGCFEQLEETLARVRFDGARDRLFTVGDLVDRGPDSQAALAWMERPWFHSCQGNHEWMRLLPLDSSELTTWLLQNGGQWWLTLETATRQRFLKTMAALPLAMEIATVQGRIGIVHADVSPRMSWTEFIAALERGDANACEDAIWSRLRAEGRWREPVRGIERVVCGHTIMADGEPHTLGNVWFIDSGAFLFAPRARLTLLSTDALFGPPAPPPGY